MKRAAGPVQHLQNGRVRRIPPDWPEASASYTSLAPFLSRTLPSHLPFAGPIPVGPAFCFEDGLKHALTLIFGDSNIDGLQRRGIAMRI